MLFIHITYSQEIIALQFQPTSLSLSLSLSLSFSLPVLCSFFRCQGPQNYRIENFNKKHSGTRMIVEQAFGRLKGRWLILAGRQLVAPREATDVAFACMILHNLCSQCPDSAYRDSWDTQRDNVYVENGIPLGEHSYAANLPHRRTAANLSFDELLRQIQTSNNAAKDKRDSLSLDLLE